MDLNLSPRVVRRILFSATAVIAFLGSASVTAYYEADRELVGPFKEALSLSDEQNLPTWFSSTLHALSAALLALVACKLHRNKGRFLIHWAFLSLTFFYISLDEATVLHEGLHGLVDSDASLLRFNWVIPTTVILFVGWCAYFPFLRHLPTVTRKDFVTAGSIFVGGALLMELPLGLWTDTYGSDNMGYVLIDAVEGTMEMLGASLFVVALMRHLGGEQGHVALHIRDAEVTSVRGPLPLPTPATTPAPTQAPTLVERATQGVGRRVLQNISATHEAPWL